MRDTAGVGAKKPRERELSREERKKLGNETKC